MEEQSRVLIRARGLAAFRAALVRLVRSGAPIDARRRAVLVPTRAAGELLSRLDDLCQGVGCSHETRASMIIV